MLTYIHRCRSQFSVWSNTSLNSVELASFLGPLWLQLYSQQPWLGEFISICQWEAARSMCELYTYLLHTSIIFTWIQLRACTDEEEAAATVMLKSSPHCGPNDCCYWKLLAAASWPLCWTSVAVPNRSSAALWSYCIMFLLRCLLPKSHALLAMFVGDDIS